MVEASDVLILGNNEPRFAEVLQNLSSDKQVVDLVGFMEHSTQANREGICW